MKFTCEKALLVSALSTASRTVSPRSSISSLEGLRVEAAEELSVTGYNLETGVTVRVEAEIGEKGVCVLPTRLFFDIVRKLPDEMVSVSVSPDLQVSVRGGASSFRITALDAENYPELPEVEYHNTVSLPQGALKDLISGTIFAVSDNQARPIHTGCLFETEGSSIVAVGVDGYRMALRRYRFEETLERALRFVAPAAALREVERILAADAEEPVKIFQGPKHLLFEIGRATLVCRLLEGDFLDWKRVLPANRPIKLVGNVSALMDSVERVGLVVCDRVKSPVRCVFGSNEVDMRTITTIGTAHDSCTLAGDGGGLEIGFNCRFLLDALGAIPEEETTLELSNGLSPVVFTPTDGGESYAYMVLPVRLKEN